MPKTRSLVLTPRATHQVMVGEVHGCDVGVSSNASPEQPSVHVKQPAAPQDVNEQEVRVDLEVEYHQRAVVVQRPQPASTIAGTRAVLGEL